MVFSLGVGRNLLLGDSFGALVYASLVVEHIWVLFGVM